ncbi:MAG: hypothetical protein K2Y37_10220 [Pirellulales bacterium]|nr:hypothetical protein [Pirellulales bacterium]
MARPHRHGHNAHGRKPCPSTILLVLWTLLAAGVARAQDDGASEPPADSAAADAGPAARVASLIRDLGHDSFAKRQVADDELMRLGDEGREQLEIASRSSDPEIRARAVDLLRRIKVDELWGGTRVRLAGDEQSAATLVKQLATASGNKLVIGEGYEAFRDKPIHVSDDEQFFWQALDELCRKSGNQVRPHYDTREAALIISAGAGSKAPVAYAGPLRMEVTSARREFREDLHYKQLERRATHAFQLNLQAMWESRFRLVAYRVQPELVEAVTDTGQRLALCVSPTGWNICGPETRQVPLEMKLHPPLVSAEQLDRLHLRWSLMAVGDFATLEVTDFAKREPHHEDDIEVIVEEQQLIESNQFQLTLLVARPYAVPEPHEVLFQENRFELTGADDKPWGLANLVQEMHAGAVRAKLTFRRPSTAAATDQPARLKVHYPRIRSQRALDLVLTDVPLPHGRPD